MCEQEGLEEKEICLTTTEPAGLCEESNHILQWWSQPGHEGLNQMC